MIRRTEALSGRGRFRHPNEGISMSRVAVVACWWQRGLVNGDTNAGRGIDVLEARSRGKQE